MFELFEHTADLGLRVRGPDLTTLFRDAGDGLFSIIAEPWTRKPASREFRFALEARRIDDLFFDWLNELLYTFDTSRYLLSEFELEMGPLRLEARAAGVEFDPVVHLLRHEVKAITYHGLRVEPDPEGWLAEVIVDI